MRRKPTYRPVVKALPLLMLLMACQTVEEPQAATPDVYFTAVGNEPGWIVRFDQQNIAFEGDYGETGITVPKPEGRPSINGMRYVTDTLVVDVTHATCADVMSGQRFAETVTVFANGKEYKGCGGRKLPPESLNNTDWRITMIDQTPVAPDAETSLRFADGRVTGTAGCNRITGSYSVKRSDVFFSQVATTKMLCSEELAKQEASFLALIDGTVSTRYTADGDLILYKSDGRRATLRQVI